MELSLEEEPGWKIDGKATIEKNGKYAQVSVSGAFIKGLLMYEEDRVLHSSIRQKWCLKEGRLIARAKGDKITMKGTLKATGCLANVYLEKVPGPSLVVPPPAGAVASFVRGKRKLPVLIALDNPPMIDANRNGILESMEAWEVKLKVGLDKQSEARQGGRGVVMAYLVQDGDTLAKAKKTTINIERDIRSELTPYPLEFLLRPSKDYKHAAAELCISVQLPKPFPQKTDWHVIPVSVKASSTPSSPASGLEISAQEPYTEQWRKDNQAAQNNRSMMYTDPKVNLIGTWVSGSNQAINWFLTFHPDGTMEATYVPSQEEFKSTYRLTTGTYQPAGGGLPIQGDKIVFDPPIKNLLGGTARERGIVIKVRKQDFLSSLELANGNRKMSFTRKEFTDQQKFLRALTRPDQPLEIPEIQFKRADGSLMIADFDSYNESEIDCWVDGRRRSGVEKVYGLEMRGIIFGKTVESGNIIWGEKCDESFGPTFYLQGKTYELGPKKWEEAKKIMEQEIRQNYRPKQHVEAALAVLDTREKQLIAHEYINLLARAGKWKQGELAEMLGMHPSDVQAYLKPIQELEIQSLPDGMEESMFATQLEKIREFHRQAFLSRCIRGMLVSDKFTSERNIASILKVSNDVVKAVASSL